MRIEAPDRAGLERLLRYCARPTFASERLAWDGPDQTVRYTLPGPLPTGQSEFTLTPLKLLERFAALFPPPRRHWHYYFGVFAPHAALLAPRARAPPDFEAEPVGALGFAFDRTPSWDPTTPAPAPAITRAAPSRTGYEHSVTRITAPRLLTACRARPGHEGRACPTTEKGPLDLLFLIPLE